MSRDDKGSGVDWGDWEFSAQDTSSNDRATADALDAPAPHPGALDIKSAAQAFVDSIVADLEHSSALKEAAPVTKGQEPGDGAAQDLAPAPGHLAHGW
ncbi:MAG: hypothetical protein AAGI01_18525 [Myxococcota bacterium]